MYVRLLGALLGLDRYFREPLFLPIASRRYLLSDRNCSDQTGHKNFEVRKVKSHRFFILVSESEMVSLLVYPTMHMYVDDPMNDKKNRSKLFQMEEVKTIKFSVSVAPAYLQYAGCG